MEKQKIRNGDWIQTFSGIQFYPLDPQIQDISIQDIAHSLSHTCRFNGHCSKFYSVAEHCILGVKLAQKLNFSLEEQKWILLHDASEGYISDVPRPIKGQLVGYKEIEKNIENVIAQKFKLPLEMPSNVKKIDNILLASEKHQVMNIYLKWTLLEDPDGNVRVKFWTPKKAKKKFLKMYFKLFG